MGHLVTPPADNGEPSPPRGGDEPGRVVLPQAGRVPRVRAAVAGDVGEEVVVADVLVAVVVRHEGVVRAAVACPRAEGGIQGELGRAVAGLQVQLEVEVPDVVTGSVGRLEGDARAVGQAGLDDPGRV